jgi:predicted metal-dependent HD superfamily phosphohydrolase
MEFEKARKYILDRIEKELPSFLYYHSYTHVLDVYDSVQTLAALEGFTGEDLTLLKTAALFHDAGFIIRLFDHEIVGCGIVRDTLPEFGYNQSQIDKICGMIMATKIPQTPYNKLEEIICDADLDYLGRDDFNKIGNSLFRELKHQSLINNEEDWNNLQLKFLSKHQYFTKSAKTLRQATKEAHLIEIKKIVESYKH